MDAASKHILLTHLYWIENGISREDIYDACQKIKEKDIFSNPSIAEIEEHFGYKPTWKDIITAEDYEKITFLWLFLFRHNLDLSLLRYCTQLEDLNIGCYNETNLDALQQNTKLTRIIANNNKLHDIKALYAHLDLAYLNFENNPSLSLKPIAHLRKIVELNAGLIAEEKYALQILRNNAECKMTYFIAGGETDFENLHIPYYYFVITKEEHSIEIDMEGVQEISPYPTETLIPTELLDNRKVYKKIMAQAYKDVSYRLEQILGQPVSINKRKSYTFGNSYHLNYVHSLFPVS